MAYISPTQGPMTFGWNAPLTVGWQVVDIHGNQRFDNPFVSAPVGSKSYRFRAEGVELTLNFNTNTREVKGR